jgi:YVTN family beta-propeller protein
VEVAEVIEQTRKMRFTLDFYLEVTCMRFLARMSAVGAVLLLSLQLSAQNPTNPIQIALLRWYQADTAAIIPMQSTCINPQGEAFDGAHIWVACTGSAPPELEEYNASDAAFVRKVTLANAPNFLLYDGANIWATNPAAGKITAVQASSGSVLGTVTVGTGPAGMAFDGQYIWVVNSVSNSITQVQALTRTVTATITVSVSPYNCVGPTSISFITSTTPAYNNLSTSIWVVCGSQPPQVMELTATGGFVAVTATNAIGGSPGCHNIAFDGRYIWLPTSSGPTGYLDAVLQIDTTNLAVTPTGLPTNSDPIAVAFDGKYIWVARSDGDVSKVLQSTGAVVDNNIPSGGGSTYMVAFDGGYVWVSTPSPMNGAYSISKM